MLGILLAGIRTVRLDVLRLGIILYALKISLMLSHLEPELKISSTVEKASSSGVGKVG